MDFTCPEGYETAAEGLLGFTHGAAALGAGEAGDHVAHLQPGEHLKDLQHIPGLGAKQF